jgi:phospholipid/cholesterol/gamma-HCH transport system substrate-binding protein
VARFSNEFLVGLLSLFVVAATIWGVLRTDDRPDGAAGGYHLFVDFDSAEGVYADTPVRIAGVPIGNVDDIQLVGSTARARLSILGSVSLPADSYAELKSEGMLGDKFIRVTPGHAAVTLKDGDTLKALPPGADLDAVTAKVSAIADDVKSITATVRSVTEDQATRDQLKATIDNIQALSEELRAIAGENRQDLSVIADNLRTVSETMARVVDKTGQSVDVEMAAIQGATATLDRTATNLEAITKKVNDGEGTVGKLINDSTTIDSINDTVTTVNGLVSDVSKIRTEVYYRGDYFYGSDPNDPADPSFNENPVAGGTRNVVGLRLMPREDYWYDFELVSHPLGSISYEDHSIPDLGTAYREYVVRPDFRLSFQFAKRFHDLVLRFGVKESSGGIGADWMLFRDRVQLSADVFDFTYGSWPKMDGIPNVQLTARVTPWRHVYVEGGLDNVALGARYGYVTGFAGGGFTFDDQDLKFVLAALPLSP